jgi:hypothetical protein
VSSGGIAVNTTLDVANNTVNVALTVSEGSVGVGGSNTQVQFNDSGAANGSAGMIFDKATNNFSLGNTLTLNTIAFPQARQTTIFANSSTTSNVVIDSFTMTDYRAAEYLLTVKDNTINAYQMVKLLVIHDGGVAYASEFGTVSTNGDIATITATANSTHVIINHAGLNNNTSVKGFKTYLAVV